MVVIMDNETGSRVIEMDAQAYDDAVLLAEWAEVPRLAAEREVAMPRLAEAAEEPASTPLADPEFIARVYRSQR